MKLTNPVSAQPANLLYDIVTAPRGVTDIIVDLNGLRFRPIHDADVLFSRVFVFEPQDYSSFFRRGRDLFKIVAYKVHLRVGLHCSRPEKRKEDHSGSQSFCDWNRVGYPALTEGIVF